MWHLWVTDAQGCEGTASRITPFRQACFVRWQHAAQCPGGVRCRNYHLCNLLNESHFRDDTTAFAQDASYLDLDFCIKASQYWRVWLWASNGRESLYQHMCWHTKLQQLALSETKVNTSHAHVLQCSLIQTCNNKALHTKYMDTSKNQTQRIPMHEHTRNGLRPGC